MANPTRPMTIEEFQRDGPDAGLWELVNGDPVQKPFAGARQARITASLVGHLWAYVEARRLGYVYPVNTGFVLAEAPPAVRTPSGAFVRMEQFSATFDHDGYLRVPPDIAIEGTSQWDTIAHALARVVMWLEAGTPLVWLADALGGTVFVCSQESSPRVLAGDDALDGEDILPGFTLPLRDIFAP